MDSFLLCFTQILRIRNDIAITAECILSHSGKDCHDEQSWLKLSFITIRSHLHPDHRLDTLLWVNDSLKRFECPGSPGSAKNAISSYGLKIDHLLRLEPATLYH
ncbi:hypothetical protein Tco_1165860 [Tanacetum coccineum]